MTKEDLDLFNRLLEKILVAEKKTALIQPTFPENIIDHFDLKLSDNPISASKFEKILEKIISNTPKTSSNLFFNQLFGGRQSKATLGDLISVILNNTMATYKVAGPQVGVEQVMVNKIGDLIGYPNNSLGTMTPGGSLAIFKSMLMARDLYDQNCKLEGISKKMTLYTSSESHYSVSKNASFIGIGKNQVRYVNVDKVGRMDPDDLEKKINEDLNDGFLPFYINATCGTTVLGAIDPIDSIACIAQRYNLWLHVDGSFLGSIIFSDKYRFLLKGISRSNSFNLNCHKILNAPLSTSFIITKHPEYMRNTFSSDANYLYQTSSDNYNLGKISLQCGRRNDALKMWCLWKSIGTKGLGRIVENGFFLADLARAYIKKNPNYNLYSFEYSTTVCFNYKNIPAKNLCTELYKTGTLMVGYGEFNGLEFIRLALVNGNNTEKEIMTFFNKLERFVETNF